jgi:hypothetical protein
MAVGISSLSQVCRTVGQMVGAGINDNVDSRINVVIGTPAAASPAESATEHSLNLFFFRFEPSGFFPDNRPGDTWMLRMHCLITPFCVNEDTIAAGENDLRVMGEVLRFFHEQPVAQVAAGNDTFLLQFVFLTLGLDQLNQIWATQGDTIYRPSALYEVSLVPVIPDKPAIDPPRVASIGSQTRATMDARDAAAPALQTYVPITGVMAPLTATESWAPALCLVSGGACVQAVSYEVGSAALAAFAPRAWVAGAPAAKVVLRWEIWQAAGGWAEGEASASFPLVDAGIDAGAVAQAATQPLQLPFVDRPGQFMLYAERSYARAADGVVVTVRSNPVLVALWETAP